MHFSKWTEDPEVGKNDNPSHPDYIPSVKMGYSSARKVTPKQQLDRFQRASGRETTKRKLHLQDENRMTAAQALLDISNIPDPNVEPPEQEFEAETPVNVHETCIKIIAELRIQKKQLCNEILRLTEKVQQLETEKNSKPHKFSSADIKDNSERTTFFTGIPSYAAFLWLTSLVSSCLPKSDLLSKQDMVLMTLMRLRINIPNQFLAYLFHVSTGFVSEIINTGIVEIAKSVAFLVRWPGKDEIIRRMPGCFTGNLRRCVSIIDCTEVYIETPSNFTARASTYSNYKHFNTLKFLVSIAPCGAVSFISTAYGGRVSDKVVTQRCGYLENIEHGDLVLADRGFLIREELASRGAELLIPSFTRGKTQLSPYEVEYSRRIARVRIHVERMMDRLKNFRILAQKMPISMVPHANNIMTVCAAIVNMHPNIITK